MTDLLASLAAVVAPVFLITGIGWWWSRRGLGFDQAFVTDVVRLVGTPCLVFSALTRLRLGGADLAVMAEAALACVVLFAVVATLALRLLRLPVGTYLPSLAFPNTGNMGLPVCLFAFGERGLALATLYFAVITVCQFTLGPAIASGRLRPELILKVPFVWAVLAALGVAWLGIPVPLWLSNTVSLAAGLAIPLMLLTLGVALAQLRVSHLGRALGLSAGRIVLGLVGGWAVAALFGLDGAARGVVMIQSAMPVAVFNYLFALMYGRQPEEVAGMVLLSTVLSYITLPLLVAAVM